ncbi:MAG: ATP-binding protein [Bdellovibrionales bacterium]|nr:ATP-binding protein [Bdellovibrionales bacterium]
MKWILVSGPPGAGKSTLANVLAHALGTAVIDKDCIDEPFSPDDRGPSYTKNIEPKVLTAIFSLCERNFSNGVSLIVDLPWTHILIASPNWKSRVLEISDKFDCDLKVIELCIEEDLLKERIQKRGLARDKNKLSAEGWEKFKATDHIDQTIDLPCLQLDAGLELTEKIKRALEYIKS